MHIVRLIGRAGSGKSQALKMISDSYDRDYNAVVTQKELLNLLAYGQTREVVSTVLEPSAIPEYTGTAITKVTVLVDEATEEGLARIKSQLPKAFPGARIFAYAAMSSEREYVRK